MLNPEILRNILPGIVTSVAVNYPIAYINSITFQVKNKMVAACFWNHKKEMKKPEQFFTIDNHRSGCYIFHSNEDILNSEVEILGTDASGRDFIVSLPYEHIVRYKIAS